MSQQNYVFRETGGRPDAPVIFTFHGTGGNETQFHNLASELVAGARVISPRGDVSENGAARFFKRTGEGVYDMPDLENRTQAMADFIQAHVSRWPKTPVIGLGYSNGANILASVVFHHPKLFQKVILLHPLVTWTPKPAPDLASVDVLMTAGLNDPICPPQQTRALEAYFSAQGTSVSTHWHEGGHEIARSELAAMARFLDGQGG
ncbi:alpha/beta hydrolase [Roseobacter sp. YSTF-M11]|uniref:Alpha/beta hydrolase n=1 Tax=Roseobacter insulae TaxID=2859783 RepID=A0A9X1JZ77_9RHOB|nr:alpha/beta hydrolase [Roseobacter insulae]MBW4708960.1 alpha/beta hydrolase [Roseobacter insulae]